jgi:hypothetical protein
MVQRKLEQIREEIKVSEQSLNNAYTTQVRLKTEELQRLLDITHTMLLTN